MSPLGWLAMGVFWVVVLSLIVWLLVQLLPGSQNAPARPPDESALEVLDRRLAAGEIDQQTWQDLRTALAAAQRNKP